MEKETDRPQKQPDNFTVYTVHNKFKNSPQGVPKTIHTLLVFA